MSVKYHMEGDAVVITDEFGTIPLPFDTENLEAAIEYIKDHSDWYKTVKAYRQHLSKYEGALAFLRKHTSARA